MIEGEWRKEETPEACLLCAIKHVAKAKALWLEMWNGYPYAYWDVLGNLGLAEDHLIFAGQDELRAKVRAARRELEWYPKTMVNFSGLLNEIALIAKYNISVIFHDMESDKKETV